MAKAAEAAKLYPTVADLMQRDVVTVEPGTPVLRVARLLERQRIHGIPVVDHEGNALGMLSATDLLWLGERVQPGTLLEGKPWEELDHLTVADVMTPDAFGLEPTDSVGELMSFFTRTGVHRALVLEGRKLVGVVSLMDLLRVITGRAFARDDTG
jgi:CBS domain-containing protein